MTTTNHRVSQTDSRPLVVLALLLPGSLLSVAGPVSAFSGYKRTDGQPLLAKSRSSIGDLLKKLKDDGLIKQL